MEWVIGLLAITVIGMEIRFHHIKSRLVALERAAGITSPEGIEDPL